MNQLQRARPGDRIVIEESRPAEILHRDFMPPVEMPATSHTTGTHTDRALAFSLRTFQLSAFAGVATWLVGSWGFELPLVSLAAFAVLSVGFCAVWLAAFVLDALASPEGVALYNARQFWRYLEREQRERLGR